jgi:putative endopeptidase
MLRRLVLVPLLLLAAAVALTAAPAAAPPTLWRGIDTTGMDPSVKPWDDFYRYANGKWLERVELPADRPRVFVFTLLQDSNLQKLHEILEDAAKDAQGKPDSVRGKVGAFYKSGMDEAKIEAAGATPLKPELERIAALRQQEDLLPALAHLQGMSVRAAFLFGASPDEKDSRREIAELHQGGLGMPDRDYYLKDEPRMKKIRDAYRAHVQKMFELLGDDAQAAEREAKVVLDLETRLAKASRSRVELRDPHRNYHLMTVKELDDTTPGVSWQPYFRALGLDDLKELNVGQPPFVEELGRVLKDVSLEDWKAYLRWHLVNAYADVLSSPFAEEDFHFNGTVLQGIPRDRPRWERVVMATDRLLGEALGQLYVAKEFPPEAKARADAMVRNLKQTLRERLAHLDWMSPKTREQALRKLDAMAVKIGYPTKWRDYSGLAVDGDVFAKNVMAAHAFDVRYRLDKIGKPVDRDEWHMTPPTVNAYYNPNLNEIVFPAGILQPPFFDPKADDPLNYGAIGTVIGHEMTHGFDDQGRKYDAAGNLRDWWLPEDELRYKERAAKIAAQYGGYVALDDQHINGQLTLGENIADLGGVKIAHVALQKALRDKPEAGKIDGFTPEQRFFLAYAQIWRGKMRPEAQRLRLLTDPHSPGRFRVLGPLFNMPEFFEAFGVTTEEAKGHLNPTPVSIW